MTAQNIFRLTPGQVSKAKCDICGAQSTQWIDRSVGMYFGNCCLLAMVQANTILDAASRDGISHPRENSWPKSPNR